MKTVIIKGGLGNQLFQICLYFFLIELKISKKIYIDNRTGFIYDFKHKRKFEFNNNENLFLFAPNYIKLLNLFLVFVQKFFPVILKYLPFICYNDISYISFFKRIIELKNQKNNYEFNKNIEIFNGYFQNFQIVNKVMPQILRVINPYLNKKCSANFSNLYKSISSAANPVSIGIRFYEESPDNEACFRNGSKKTPKDFNQIIKKLEQTIDSPNFFIFVQEENEFTNKLIFNSPYNFITNNKGYNGAWENLKAQSMCLHHVFNNSSFYWWGCVLSKFLNKNVKFNSQVFASDNFMYKEIYDPTWKTF